MFREFFGSRGHRVSGQWRCVCASSLVVALALLGSLAHANLPDPSWVPGIYDGADYDDVIVLVTSGTEGVSRVRGADLQPILEVTSSPAPFPEGVINNLSRVVVLPRGPPSS